MIIENNPNHPVYPDSQVDHEALMERWFYGEYLKKLGDTYIKSKKFCSGNEGHHIEILSKTGLLSEFTKMSGGPYSIRLLYGEDGGGYALEFLDLLFEGENE